MDQLVFYNFAQRRTKLGLILQTIHTMYRWAYGRHTSRSRPRPTHGGGTRASPYHSKIAPRRLGRTETNLHRDRLETEAARPIWELGEMSRNMRLVADLDVARFQLLINTKSVFKGIVKGMFV